MKEKITEFLGWYGIVAILVAYILISVGYFNSESLWYQLFNFTGAIGVIVDAWQDRNIQPVVLNSVWLAVALFALLKMLLN